MNVNKKLIVKIAAVCAALGLPAAASAICLGVCEVLIGGLIAAALGLGTADYGPQAIAAGQDPAKLKAMVEELKKDRDLSLIRLGNAGGRPGNIVPYGFDDLIAAYNRANDLNASPRRKASAEQDLAEIRQQNPAMFTELDKLAVLAAKHFGAELAAQVYGAPTTVNNTTNFQRYAKLAVDAKAMQANRLNMKFW